MYRIVYMKILPQVYMHNVCNHVYKYKGSNENTNFQVVRMNQTKSSIINSYQTYMEI